MTWYCTTKRKITSTLNCSVRLPQNYLMNIKLTDLPVSRGKSGGSPRGWCFWIFTFWPFAMSGRLKLNIRRRKTDFLIMPSMASLLLKSSWSNGHEHKHRPRLLSGPSWKANNGAMRVSHNLSVSHETCVKCLLSDNTPTSTSLQNQYFPKGRKHVWRRKHE